MHSPPTPLVPYTADQEAWRSGSLSSPREEEVLVPPWPTQRRTLPFRAQTLDHAVVAIDRAGHEEELVVSHHNECLGVQFG